MAERPSLKIVAAKYDGKRDAVGIKHPEAVIALIDTPRRRKTAFWGA
jgi:hypothetical protein